MESSELGSMSVVNISISSSLEPTSLTGGITLRFCLGTNTDSVVIDITRTKDTNTRGVVASFKHETTGDITTGIEIAVKKVLERAGIGHGSDQIISLTIGTTVGGDLFVVFLDFIDLFELILAFY